MRPPRRCTQSANTAYKLIWRLADCEAVGPVLLGMARPVHVLQRGVAVADIVNMAALCVVDAQEMAVELAADGSATHSLRSALAATPPSPVQSTAAPPQRAERFHR